MVLFGCYYSNSSNTNIVKHYAVQIICDNTVLDHHVSGHGSAAGGLQVLGAALLLWLAGEHIVGVIQSWQ